MSTEYGADERALLASAAGDLYLDIAKAGSLAVNDPSCSGPAFELLVDIGLIVLVPKLKSYLPVDPVAIQSRVIAPISQRASDLLVESTSWTKIFAQLGQAYRRTSTAEVPLTELHGLANINRFLTTAVGDAQTELLTAQPSGGRAAATLRTAAKRDVGALQRGVRMRTLYQHSARRSQATQAYVEEVCQHGAEVRTLDEFFNRLIVVDRSLAIIPGESGTRVAIAIHDRNLVAYLADIFERYWERAHDFADREQATRSDIAEDVHNMTIRLLVEGHSDHASAKRVGVSTRTFAGYISSLKEEYGAQTRFQLGYAMGQQAARSEQPADRPPRRRPRDKSATDR